MIAEQPHYVRRMFLTNHINPKGKYRIRLFCPIQRSYIVVTIDDFIPCENNRPKYARARGAEAWVLLLEKAFAKYQYSSYENIEGGFMLYALTVFTGCEIHCYYQIFILHNIIEN